MRKPDPARQFVTCCGCGWVHFAVTQAFAESQVRRFNEYYDTLTAGQRANYGNRRASLADYTGCRSCGRNEFRPAEPGDCPPGCTIGPVIHQPKGKGMTAEEVKAYFEEIKDEYLQFHRVENPPSQRVDLCAFLKLEALIPGTERIVVGSERDEIYLSVYPAELGERATKEDLLYLHRCGVRIDSHTGLLVMCT